jgi:O-antigen/teichoic acid export membrane protein
MLVYALPTLATVSVQTLITSTDTFFLTLLKGVKEVGIYNIAVPMVSVISIFLSPINQMFFPLTSHLDEGEKEKIKHLVDYILKTIPFIVVYFSLFISLFPSVLTSLLFGQKWVGLVEKAIIIISIGYVFSATSSYLNSIVAGLGKIKERLFGAIIIAVVNIVCSFFLIYKFGVIGAAISNSIVYFLSFIIYSLILRSQVKFNYPIKLYIKLFIVALFIVLIIKSCGYQPEGWIQTLITGLVYSLVMFIIGHFLRIFDKNMIVSLIKTKNA